MVLVGFHSILPAWNRSIHAEKDGFGYHSALAGKYGAKMWQKGGTLRMFLLADIMRKSMD